MASVVVHGIVAESPGAESVPDTKLRPELVIGLLAAPGPASELTESLVGEIGDRLAGQLPGVRWRVNFVCDRLVQPPTDLSELIAAGRRVLLQRGWHLAVCVTDLPLQTARCQPRSRSILRPAAISSLRSVGGCTSRSETNSTRHRTPGSCPASRSAISPTRLSVSSDAGPGAASRPMTSSGCRVVSAPLCEPGSSVTIPLTTTEVMFARWAHRPHHPIG